MPSKSKPMTARQIRIAFDRLPRTEQLRLIEVFERATWPARFKQLLRRIRRTTAKYPPVPDDQIVRLCREVRKDLHERTPRRRRP